MKWISHTRKSDDSQLRPVIADSAEELRWLCYTPTGNAELSGQAVDAALQQSLKGANEVFQEWMLGWAAG